MRKYDFSRPVKITDDNLDEVRAWLRGWRGCWSGIELIPGSQCPICSSYLISRPWTTPELQAAFADGPWPRGLRKPWCPHCQGMTVVDPRVPENDNPMLTVRPNPVGWVRCPGCGYRFSSAYCGSWDGERHLTCGQRLLIEEPGAT